MIAYMVTYDNGESEIVEGYNFDMAVGSLKKGTKDQIKYIQKL